MRITLLANPDNLHVRRWIEFLAGRGHELSLVTDPFTRARPEACRTLAIRWNLWTKILAFRLTPRPFGNDRWKHLHARPLVRSTRPDVVHGFEAFNYGLATALSGPYPKVLTPWGKDVHHDADASRMGGWMIERALKGVDLISTNDETMPQFLASRFGIDPARVRAFSWGAELSVFQPNLVFEAQRWRRELEIPDGAQVILSPRNFSPYWGCEMIVEAIPEILRVRPRTAFVILRGAVGEPERMAQARCRLEGAGLAGSVRFIERMLSGAEMAALFNLAEAFISIPRTDLLAQTILEGMACGCLPILGDQPAYRKHVQPGKNALVLAEYSTAALVEALFEALRNKPLREAAREQNPRLMARHENWRTNALKMEEVYAAAIELHKSTIPQLQVLIPRKPA